MSFDLAIWKRSARTKTECYEAIIEENDHIEWSKYRLIAQFDSLIIAFYQLVI